MAKPVHSRHSIGLRVRWRLLSVATALLVQAIVARAEEPRRSIFEDRPADKTEKPVEPSPSVDPPQATPPGGQAPVPVPAPAPNAVVDQVIRATVRAKGKWQATGFLNQGTYSITATGTWIWNAQNKGVGPDGRAGEWGGRLIGRLNQGTNEFTVGSRCTLTILHDNTSIEMRCHDLDEGVDDNSGEMSVTITRLPQKTLRVVPAVPVQCRLVNKSNGLCLTLHDGNILLAFAPNNGAESQQFSVEAVCADAGVRLVTKGGGRTLGVRQSSQNAGADVIAWTTRADDDKHNRAPATFDADNHWILEPLADGDFKIVNAHSGQCLTAEQAGNPGQEPWTAGASQIWRIDADGGAPAWHPSAEPRPIGPPPTEYKNAQQIIRVVPDRLYPKTSKDSTDVRIGAANDLLKQKLVGEKATLVYVVGAVAEKRDDPELPPLKLAGNEIAAGPTPVLISAFFPDTAKASLAVLSVGDTVTISGTIKQCYFQRRDPAVLLIVNLVDPTIVRVAHKR